MLYALIGEDVADSLALRQKLQSSHRSRIEALQAEGRLVLAGPMPAIDAADPGPAGFTGSLIVAEFDSQFEAEAWFRQDPYAEQGVFRSVTVRPFRQVFPK